MRRWTATTPQRPEYLTRKEFGHSARYFNAIGKAQFNQQQITHAVLSFMSRKEQQRHWFGSHVVSAVAGRRDLWSTAANLLRIKPPPKRGFVNKV